MTDASNSRNGYTSKTIQTENGQFEINTPRERNGDFELNLVKKSQRRMPSVQDKVMHFYTQGLSTREIARTFKDLYDADIRKAIYTTNTIESLNSVIHICHFEHSFFEWRNLILRSLVAQKTGPVVMTVCRLPHQSCCS